MRKRGNCTIPRGDINTSFDYIERMLDRVRRNTVNGTVGVAVSPMPISLYCEEIGADGVVARYMFAGAGRVSVACVHVEELPLNNHGRPVDSVKLTLNIDGPNTGVTHQIHVTSLTKSDDVNVKIDAGTRLTITGPVNARGVWLGVLFHGAEHIDTKKYAVDGLLTELEKQDAGN